MLGDLRHRSSHRPRGFTLIELMVAVTIAILLLSLTAGRFREFIRVQRLKSVTAQLVTDLAFARSESASRNVPVYFTWASVPGLGMTCYSIYLTTSLPCECQLGSGSACSAPASQTEVRTVQLLNRDAVRLLLYTPPVASDATQSFGYDPVTGGVAFGTTDFLPSTPKAFGVETTIIGDTGFRLRVMVGQGGQVTACSAGSKLVSGFPKC